ncbi:hypothetical protein TorRG33x02_282390 [Trema orientale]|uniref:Uncharacterized protein n=1 Tax=Trema orientale TaxID=63057 RepID=A0A2P5CJJ7_TREOI|nr:hypothetical protein TorRG33x02_282390 [Trema orientale]
MAEDHVRITIEEEQKHNPIVLSPDDHGLLNELALAQETDDTRYSYLFKDEQITKIQRVPEIMLRQRNFKEYYKPREIPIGPLHANSKHLGKRALKAKFTAKFIKNSGQTGEILLKEIKKNINEIKQRFDEIEIHNLALDDERLSRMLFLGGCSILQFIYSYVSHNLLEFKINNGQAALIQQDLFLLENQIPFRVLIVLMNLSSQNYEWIINIYQFIFTNVMAPVNSNSLRRHLMNIKCLIPGENSTQRLFVDKEAVHLLDLLRSELLFGDGRERKHSLQRSNRYELFGDHGHERKLSLQRCNPFSDYKRSFRNVQDLKAAGIKLKPSYTCGLKSVSFTTGFFIAGQLKLPPLIVDDSTARKLLNLVAYEMCPDNYRTNYAVTSYLSFLDSLIASEQDVKDLRSALQNHLSSDAEVAQLFNTIGSNLVPHDAYFDVKNKIQSHYERKCAVWMAQGCNDHCRSPWAILALLAAIAALVLTAIQTYCAMLSKT